MRRNRVRSYTIDAENEEDFNTKCENALKNESVNMNSLTNSNLNQKALKDHEYNQNNKNSKNKSEYNFEGFEEILSEEDLSDEIDSEDLIDKINEKTNDEEERNIELLCIYLKQSICLQAKNNIENENIFYRSKNPFHALSGNAIYDINIKELVDNIMAENEFEEKNDKLKDSEKGKGSSLKEFISHNIKGDYTLKIMVLSNNDSTKNLFINKFLGISNEKNKNEDFDDIDFEIRKKQIRLFSKNINLQIFDTSEEFHNNLSSKIYYQFSNGFFIFIEATNHNSQVYLENIFIKLEKYFLEKTVVIFGINMLFKKDCCINGFNLREFASNKNCLYVPLKINDFTIQNSIIINILHLILIKKIDFKKESIRKSSKEEKKICGIKNNLAKKISNLSSKNLDGFIYDITKMNIPNSMGYQQNYRINHINVFDTENKSIFMKKKSRKWSLG